MNVSEALQSLSINLVSSALWGLGAYIVYLGISKYRSRNEKWFWGRFNKLNLHIIFREYKIDSSSKEEEVAKHVGDGYQISKGMAVSMGKLISYCQDKVSKPEFIKATGDQTTTFDKQNESPICLGSKNNTITSQVINEISGIYTFPFDTNWDEKNKTVVIKYLNPSQEQEFRPEISEEGSGTDFALIVNVELTNGPALVIAGAHMWGTQAGVFAITDRRWLKEIRNKFDGAKNFAFILKVTISNGEPQASNIVHAVKLGALIK